MSNKVQHTLDAILTAILLITGKASLMDGIEQVGRFLLLLVSILSGVLLIVINWDKAVAIIKSKFGKNGNI
jgi:hypothetical protein